MKSLSFLPHDGAQVFLAIALMSVFLCGGCISRPPLQKETFNFSIPAACIQKSVTSDRSLRIRNLEIARAFEGRALIYRTGEFTYVRDPYAEFLESPADELTAAVREGLCKEGVFRSVVEAGNALKPDTLVEISVSQLYGDFRQPQRPAAVMTMRFVFLDAPNGFPGKELFQREYSRSIPLPQPSAAALMEGWNQALTEILTSVSSDLRHSPNMTSQNQLHAQK